MKKVNPKLWAAGWLVLAAVCCCPAASWAQSGGQITSFLGASGPPGVAVTQGGATPFIVNVFWSDQTLSGPTLLEFGVSPGAFVGQPAPLLLSFINTGFPEPLGVAEIELALGIVDSGGFVPGGDPAFPSVLPPLLGTAVLLEPYLLEVDGLAGIDNFTFSFFGSGLALPNESFTLGVQLTPTIPEPATAGWLFAAAGLVLTRRRRRRGQ